MALAALMLLVELQQHREDTKYTHLILAALLQLTQIRSVKHLISLFVVAAAVVVDKLVLVAVAALVITIHLLR